MELLDDDDMVGLLEGKKVKGVKLDKNLRREVKHMINRNEVFLLFDFRILILLIYWGGMELYLIIRKYILSLTKLCTRTKAKYMLGFDLYTICIIISYIIFIIIY